MADTVASQGTPSAKHRGFDGRLVVVVAVVAAIAAGGFIAYYAGYFQGPPSYEGPSIMGTTCSSLGNSTSPVPHVATSGSGNHAYFLIVEADPYSPYAGMNGSYYVPPTQQWPIMNVKLGQVVSIRVINCASNEIHGFNISYYDNSAPNAVQTGQSYTVTFTATKAGTFRVFCSIFCSIHPLMQNGALIVTQ